MFRKKDVNASVMSSTIGTMEIVIAIIGSLLFGLILRLPLWYSYTFRCMIFLPLGYWFAEKGPYESGWDIKKKICANIIYIGGFSLLFFLLFTIVFSIKNLMLVGISCIVPFAIGLFISPCFLRKEIPANDHSAECPYEIEIDSQE